MKKTLKFIFLLIFTLLIVSAVYFCQNLKTAVYNSLIYCGSSLIPSLIPMMFITFTLINSGALFWLPKPLVWLFVFFINSISGYPSSGKIYNSLASTGFLKKDIAERLVPTTVCAGPAFIINFIGYGIFNSKLLGVLLYASLVLSNFIIFIIRGGYKLKLSKTSGVCTNKLIVISAKESIEAITGICSYVIIFSAISEIIYSCFGEIAKTIFIYITEITGAVTSCDNIYKICALLSFGGICVLMQILSLTPDLKLKVMDYFKIRLLSCVFSLIILKILLTLIPIKIPSFTNLEGATVISHNSGKTYFITLILTLITLLISFNKNSSGKFLKDIDVFD